MPDDVPFTAAIRDRFREAELQDLTDETLLERHTEVHDLWRIRGDEPDPGYVNGHRAVLGALAERDIDHPDPPDDTEGLDEATDAAKAEDMTTLCVLAKLPPGQLPAWADTRDAVEDATGAHVEPWDEPHITLLYAGETERDNADRAADIVETIAGETAPIKVAAGDVVTFDPSDNSKGKVPVVVEAVGDGLAAMHDQLSEAFGDMVTAEQFPEYRPHITLGYAVDDIDRAKADGLGSGIRFTLDKVTLCIGDGDHRTYPLKGTELQRKAEPARQPEQTKAIAVSKSWWGTTQDDGSRVLYSVCHLAYEVDGQGDWHDREDIHDASVRFALHGFKLNVEHHRVRGRAFESGEAIVVHNYVTDVPTVYDSDGRARPFVHRELFGGEEIPDGVKALTEIGDDEVLVPADAWIIGTRFDEAGLGKVEDWGLAGLSYEGPAAAEFDNRDEALRAKYP